MRWSKDAIDELVSPSVVRVTRCGASDIGSEWDGRRLWLPQYLYTAASRSPYKAGSRGIALLLMRKVETAIDAYAHGREHLIRAVSPTGRQWVDYFRALNQFEISMGQTYQAMDACRKFSGGDVFKSGDGTEAQRLNTLYNVFRHAPLAETDDQPVLISDAGFECADASLRFEEYEDLLRLLAHFAQRIAEGSKANFPPDQPA